MLSPYRTIAIDVEGIGTVEVPFTVELLHRVEDTLQKTEGRVWFILRRSDKSILQVFEEFCRPYLDIDFSKVQPTFCALFFSSVRSELVRSINDCMNSMTSTNEPDEPTVEKKAEAEA